MAPRVLSYTSMPIHYEKPVLQFNNADTTVKAAFARQGLNRIDGPAAGEPELIAYIKVISPLTSTGPSIRSLVLSDSASLLIVRFPHIVFAGSLVQVRIQSKILFGKARRCTANACEYEIEIEKQETISL